MILSTFLNVTLIPVLYVVVRSLLPAKTKAAEELPGEAE
jgi:hypothetical protein